MTNPLHLRAMQALDLALRTRSLTLAAERLAITPAAVGQRIRALEDYLGVDLIVRGRSGIMPTPALEKAAEHLATGFRELEQAARILDFQRIDEIHISGDTDWADLWLAPRLHRFRNDNPNLGFCINGVGDVPLRLGHEDLRIYFGEPETGPNCDVLFNDYVLPVCVIENAVRTENVPRERQLEGIPLLHLVKYTDAAAAMRWPDWIERFGHRPVAGERGIRYSHSTLALEACLSGAGFLLSGIALLLDRLLDKTLVMPFAVKEGTWTRSGFCAGYGTASVRKPAVQRFRQWLREEARDTEAAIASFVHAIPPD